MARSLFRIFSSLRRRSQMTRERKLVEESGIFDPEWYVARYRDVQNSGVDPLEHYLTYGWREKRDPGPGFSTFWYLSQNEDVNALGVNPLLHYIQFGRGEGRPPAPPQVGVSSTIERHLLADLPSLDTSPIKVGVVLHVFYEDLAVELLDAALRIPGDVSIFVAAVTPAAIEVSNAWANENGFTRLDARLIPNKGRNVASWTAHLGPELLKFDLICHLHTKKSLHTGSEQSSWRSQSVRQLVGGREHAAQVLSLFQSNPRLGVVAPAPHPSVNYLGFTWLTSRQAGKDLAERIGVDLTLDGYIDFPAGNMFWARPAALKELLVEIKLQDFPEEAGQNDGTLGHAIERAMYMVAQANGFDWAELNDESYWFNWSSKNLSQYAESAHYESITHAIDQSRTVSFDIFETLVTRIVPTQEHLYRLVGQRIGIDYASLRAGVSAETYEGVFEELIRKGMPKEAADRARALEFELDVQLTRPRSRLKEAFQYALDKGKRVILVVDSPYSSEQIEHLLCAQGIAGHQATYVSSERGARKDTGELWKLVAEKEAPVSELLHIGDEELGDMMTTHGCVGQVKHVMSPVNMFALSSVGRSLGPDPYAIPFEVGPVIATAFNDPFKGDYLC